MANILSTERLVLKKMTAADAPFILALLNTPSFIKYIGDRKVRKLEEAENYIINGPMRSYDENDFGLWIFALKKEKIPLGICGLIKREGLLNVDIGFAIMPEFEGKGFAFEIASAIMDYGKNKLGLQRILAITTKKNLRSIKLLEKLGLKYEKIIQLGEDKEKLMLFGN